jgi:isopenicillin N synthase-like dioxygenase
MISPPIMPDTLPFVDLESSAESDRASLTRMAAGVGAACRNVGFFYVVNHGVEATLIAEAFAQSRRFFALPLADKQALAMKRSAATEAIPGSCTKRSTPAGERT